MSGSSSYFDITGTMWIVSTFIVLGLKGMWVRWLWGFPITAFYLHPIGRIATPAEVAEVIAFLAHERASFVTGAVWTVDGGLLTLIGGTPRRAQR